MTRDNPFDDARKEKADNERRVSQLADENEHAIRALWRDLQPHWDELRRCEINIRLVKNSDPDSYIDTRLGIVLTLAGQRTRYSQDNLVIHSSAGYVAMGSTYIYPRTEYDELETHKANLGDTTDEAIRAIARVAIDHSLPVSGFASYSGVLSGWRSE